MNKKIKIIKKEKTKVKLFTEKVLAVVRGIKKGSVMTYGEVAKRAGSVGASRAVGSIMKANFDKTVPCHRVIPTPPKAMRDKPELTISTVGAYNRGGPRAKLALLRKEGALL